MRFDGHFWPNQQSSNVYFSSSRFRTATSLVISGNSLPSRNREYHLKSLIVSEPHSRMPFDFCRSPALKQNYVQLSLHFRHPRRIKKTDFTRQVIIRTLPKINKQTSVCERMLVDNTSWVDWPIDCSSSKKKKKSVLKHMDRSVYIHTMCMRPYIHSYVLISYMVLYTYSTELSFIMNCQFAMYCTTSKK
jgi:hypothetical protein